MLNGTVVITSRRSTGWRGIPTVPLDVLSPSEAKELLAQSVRADWPDADLDGARRLCTDLGCLPLAVQQAGAYLAQTRITPAAYLTLLEKYPERMFTATSEGGDAQRTMARIWHVTLDRLADTPSAGQMLRQLAWYAPDGIPRVLVTGTDSEPDKLEALGRLAAYSMITLEADTISVHRLVQAVTRTPDPNDPHRRSNDIAQARDTTTETLADAIAEADPHLPADWPVFRTVLPHVLAVLFANANPSIDTALHCSLADRLGRYVYDQGITTLAITLFSRATHGYESLHGPDHLDTLNSRNNLASAYESAGDLKRAIPLYEAILVDTERVLGSGHPQTLTSRNNLAYSYQAAGNLELAIPLYETTLPDRERVLGPNHPDTLTSRNNLAYAYKMAGDLGQAMPLYETTLADTKRVLGPDHPHTLRSQNNLAGAYYAAGHLRHAISLYEATAADHKRVLGRDHQNTLIARNNLAAAYQAAGDLDQAIPLYNDTFVHAERVLGPDHRLSRTIRSNVENVTNNRD